MKYIKKQTYFEVGLAVLIAIVMGIAGNIIEDRITEQKELSALAASENESAKENKQQDAEKEIEQELQQSAENEALTDASVEAEEAIADGQYPIMGKSSVSAQQMAEWFEKNGEEYPAEALGEGGADTIEAFCQIYIEEAEAEGVRAEVAFVQSMKETAWLQFGGDASIEQYNFAGLGTTGGGVPGNSYPDVRTGVRAQIQHLKAYATEDTLSQECVDERYEYVTKGCAPYVEWLGQQENPEGYGWATDENYGYSIVEMIGKLKNSTQNL
ncbi:MAG: glucosaminidase domain-containing protein [Ruminococcus sp.]|nr:glucosaminidase domain-containing protein [Ruminococcus sp.]